MTTIDATADSLAELITAREAAEKDLRTMYRINRAFRAGRDAFVQQGFSADDYDTFAATIRRHPEYGPVPFPLGIQSAKAAQIESLNKQITIGKRLLSPARSG